MNNLQRKYKIFLASSTHSLPVAQALEKKLSEYNLEIIIWKKLGVFSLSEHTIESLEKIVNECDFGIFILSPDDLLIQDSKIYDIARDNVIFELGLFYGKLGRKRSYMLKPSGIEIKEPSDLKGITWASYKINNPNDYDFENTCKEIIKAISIAPLTPEEAALSNILFPPIVLRYCLDTFKNFLNNKLKIRIPKFSCDAQIVVCTKNGIILRHPKKSSIGKKIYTADGVILLSSIKHNQNEQPFELLLRTANNGWVLYTDSGFSQLYTDIKGRHNQRICVVYSFRGKKIVYFLEIHNELTEPLESHQLNKIKNIIGKRIIEIGKEKGQIDIVL